MAAEVHALVERAGPARLPGRRRLPADGHHHRHQARLGLGLREAARLPLGRLPARPRPQPHHQPRRVQGPARLAGGPRRVPQPAPPADRGAGRHGARIGRAAAPPRPHLPEHLRPPQPLPGERGGGQAPVGDGLPAGRLLRPRRPRRGRGAARPALGGQRQAAHPRRLQRADAGLAVVLHVHLLHRPGRQVPARLPRRERLRPAVAHGPVHAARGGAPHVHRHHRDRPGGAAHLRPDPPARRRRPRRAPLRRHRAGTSS